MTIMVKAIMKLIKLMQRYKIVILKILVLEKYILDNYQKKKSNINIRSRILKAFIDNYFLQLIHILIDI